LAEGAVGQKAAEDCHSPRRPRASVDALIHTLSVVALAPLCHSLKPMFRILPAFKTFLNLATNASQRFYRAFWLP
jgi:hypothetical protein